MMKAIFLSLLLISTTAFADCLQLDASIPHYTVAGATGSCDVAMTADEITKKQQSDAAAASAASAAASIQAAQTAANNAIAAGLSVTSTSTPSLNGTYGIDQAAQNNVNGTVTYILLNGTFPGGGSTMPWIDKSGVSHTWPSVTEFKAFATAYANYVAQIALYAASNGASGSIPSNQVTIP